MSADEQIRRCHCGTRLARDNRGVRCNACVKAAREHLARPPAVPAEFWRSEQMRAALASCEMGVVIRAFRTHPHHGRCIPQRTAASWVGVTQTRLSRIENGERIVNLNKLTRWAHVLGIPTDLLWFRVSRPEAVPRAPDIATRTRSSPNRSAMSPLSRRSLLTRAVVALPVLDADESEHVAKALGDARRYLDGDVVAHFSRQVGVAMAQDRSGGARETLPMALGIVGAVEHSAREVKADVRRSLLSVGARAAELCGWLYRELQEPLVEGFWLDRGMEWAQEAGDTAMQGYLLLKKSQMAYDERDGLRVLTLAQAAGGGPWRLPAKVRAEVVQQEALGMAMVGEPLRAVEHKLDQARRFFARAAGEQSPLGAYFGEHTLRLRDANCYTEAGKPKLAAELYAVMPVDGVLPQRNAGLHGARRAVALALSGKPDEAAAVGLKSVRAAKATHSQRTLRTLGEVVRTLEPWRDRPAPRALREALLG